MALPLDNKLTKLDDGIIDTADVKIDFNHEGIQSGDSIIRKDGIGPILIADDVLGRYIRVEGEGEGYCLLRDYRLATPIDIATERLNEQNN